MPKRIRDRFSIVLVNNDEESFFTSEKNEWNVATQKDNERDLSDIALPVWFTLVICRQSNIGQHNRADL